jgi:hypothetical protein
MRRSRSEGFLSASLFAALACCAPSGFAGRPLVTDDAGTVSPGDFEFEAGGVWHRDSGADGYEFPFGVTTGVLSTLDAGIGFGSAIQERNEATGTEVISGVGDLALGLKWNLLPAENFWASHALAFTAKLPTASRNQGIGTGETDFDLTYIASKTITETWSAHLNMGYTCTGDPSSGEEPDLFHLGFALGWFAASELELLAEVFADLPESRADDAVTQLNFGLRWGLHENLILDAAVGTRLHNDAPDLTATIGLTWVWEACPRQACGQR